MSEFEGKCPYCQLIDNPEQLLLVDETENFYAWLEINPRAKGHTQVVPKEHIESVLELSNDNYMEMSRLVRKVMERAKEGLGADGVSVTMNVEEAGGQMLPHAYVSVFPRFQEEENAGTPTGAIFPQREELQQELQNIQSSMASVEVTLEEDTHEVHPDSQNFKDADEIGEVLEKNKSSDGLTDVGKESEEDQDEEAENQRELDQDLDDSVGSQVSDMPTSELFRELVSRYGDVSDLLESKEFSSLLSDTRYSLRKHRERSGGSFDWK